MSISRKSEAILRYDRPASLDGNDSLSEVARLIAPDSTVLDLGAATGKLGLHLRERKNCVVDGVEVDAATATIARPNYRKLLQLDLETVELADHFANNVYDAIVCAD